MEGNIGAQIIILISFAASIILAITLGSRILRKARESENQNQAVDLKQEFTG